MAEVLRVGAVVKPTGSANVALADPDEQHEIAEGRRRGQLVPVRLELFADLLDGERVRRFDSIHVDGVDLSAPHDQANVDTVIEIVDQNLDRLHAHLVEEGEPVALASLVTVHCEVVLDDDLRARLGAAA